MLPAPDTLLPIAEVSKSYGIQGEIIISFRESVDLENDRPVFLLFEGQPASGDIQSPCVHCVPQEFCPPILY